MKIEHIIVIAVILIILLIVTNNSEKLDTKCPTSCKRDGECCYGYNCFKRKCKKICNISGEPCKRNRECCKKFICKNNKCM